MIFQWSDLATAAGAIAVATASMLIVQVLKAGIPVIFNHITGGTAVFVVTAVFYALGAAVIKPDSNQALTLFLSWVACAAAALGVHSAANNGAATFVQGAPKDTGPGNP